MSCNDCFLGIDPGLDGGLVWLDPLGSIVEKHVMPLNVLHTKLGGKVDERRSLDLTQLSLLLKRLAPKTRIAVLEQAQSMPKQGVSSVFKYGQVYGQIEGLLVGRRIPYLTVPPVVWSRVMHSGIVGVEPKERSIIALRRLFPDVDLRVSERAKKPHEGVMDALLLAEWGRRRALVGVL